MRVLVTGGTGLIGEGVLPCLLRAGHEVRLLARHAEGAARVWPENVEAFPADVTDTASLREAASGCDVVVHVTGIAKESPPDLTFDGVNVEGTRNVVREAQRAHVRRFVYVSSLGAPTGRSAYHRSKRAAEAIVREFDGEWIVLRPGKVYGPDDDVVSMLLHLVRTMPVVPVVASGEQRFQPIWYQDFGAVVAEAVQRSGLVATALDVAGVEVTTTNDVLDRLSDLTATTPRRLGIPAPVVALGTKVADVFGIDLPIDPQMLTMLLEENVIEDGASNGLLELGVTPTTLAEGLARLVDIQPEQMLGDGVGALERKLFWVDVRGARTDAVGLMATLKSRINDIMPIDFAAEPGAPEALTDGATMTAALPLRGTIQMRVEEEGDRRVTLATLLGHPIAGVVSFATSDRPDGALRFEVVIHWQAATRPDWLLLKTAGAPLQNANWKTVVQRMVELSGGHASDEVRSEASVLEGREARRVTDWMRSLVVDRKRADHRKEVESP